MAPSGCPLPPSSSLLPVSKLHQLTEDQIFSFLQALSALYCPLPASVAFKLSPEHHSLPQSTSTPLVDSGYTSGAEDDDVLEHAEQSLAALRADGFERNFVERWLTRFMAQAYDLPSLVSEDVRDRTLDQASWILESFVANTTDDDQTGDELSDFMREFSFNLTIPGPNQEKVPIEVRLNDGLAGKDSTDCDDVGLQSWGASIVFSELMCAQPSRFGFSQPSLGTSPRILELGAGTGLVSLVLGAMLPHLGVTNLDMIATDYHPAVLSNLVANIAANATSDGPIPVQTAFLDWSAPVLESPLDIPADILVATDAVYHPEHAVWLRDCATQLLAPDGVFWLLITVRRNGRFEAISTSVESAFATANRLKGSDGRLLTILGSEEIEKRSGIGRGDESGYRLFKLGWA
ncbi:hypothetical protein AK830_g12114 [Neonectria ditissima]|uniref:Uncharacterized protein n=1 Tax=Neonectria ditissima TaxID=78410 RepID=A0A0P7B663_9HYPO|nr:hypothetical protein AK830_g12114 [Neonectria ditissima]